MMDAVPDPVLAAAVTGLFAWLLGVHKSRTAAKRAAAQRSADAAKAEADRQAILEQAAQDRQADLSGATWAQATEWMARLDAEVKDLRSAYAELNRKHEALWKVNRELREENRTQQAQNQDQQLLIEEVAGFVLDDWRARGSKPPAPDTDSPHKIRRHIERMRRRQRQ